MAKRVPTEQDVAKWVEPRRPAEWNEKQVLKALKEGPVLVQPKVDGVRVHVVIDQDLNVTLRSRENLPFRGLGRYEEALNAPWTKSARSWLRGYTIEAELQTLDQGSGSVNTAAVTSGDLNRSTSPLVLGRARFSVFDVHNVETRAASYGSRQAFIQHELGRTVGALLSNVGQVATLYAQRAHDMEDIEVLYAYYREDLSAEGAVVTPASAPYVSGKKLGSGWKMKPTETFEAIVTGLEEATAEDGTGHGRLGSFVVKYEDGTTGKVAAGALTHDEARAIWQDQAGTLGRLIEVKAMESFETGGVRHPTFLRFRDDPNFKGVKQ